VTDALGRPTSVLVLGGTSDIAAAILRRQATPALQRVVLAARPGPRREEAAEAVGRLGVLRVDEVDFDARDTETHDDVLAAATSGGDLDLVIVAFGVLGEQSTFEDDPDAAVEAARVNYVGGVSMCLRAARLLKAQGHGTMVVLSSVAGERPRRSNFVYGSTKAGLDALANGLADSLQGSGARVVVVRPGFVNSSMTEGLSPAPFAVDPDEVAQAVVTGLRRGATVVYAPPVLRVVMSGLRHLPRSVFRRLPL
jgi:decaprenylphospho-beta-D-erythro-pentofuranosid-2-ulose 2-reductase